MGKLLSTTTPTMQRILAALERHGDLDAESLSIEACVSIHTLAGGGYLKRLVEAREIHVVAYRRNASGPFIPVYRRGYGKPAKKPRPFTNAQKLRRSRARLGRTRARRKMALVSVLLTSLSNSIGDDDVPRHEST